jgi:aryl-alcohol dehydrogenase-like predicted oxidoreductase
MPIPGFATTDGTLRFRERNLALSQTYKQLGKTGLVCSAVGFGSYRVDLRVAEHNAALSKALRMGVNLIDTSANYADGNSERLIGSVLGRMIEVGEVRREEIIVVSKGGYIQGENYERISKRVKDLAGASPEPGTELAEIVKYGQGLWHSMHPDFLSDQITRSLERLGLETIDVYLLHNPEYFLQWAVKDNMPEDEARDIYEERIAKAFAHLEKEVAGGRIKWYGVSSNTFGKPEGAVDRTSLERILNGSGEHFALVQLPMNLYERGGIIEQNQVRSTLPIIDFAKENGIGVLINRPLNAIRGNRLTRLADYPEREYPADEEINEFVHDIKLQEDEFKKGQLLDLELNPQSREAIEKLLGFGEWLDNYQWRGLAGIDEWRDLLYTVIKPRIQYVFDLLRPVSKDDKAVSQVLTEYAESLDETIEHITNYYSTRAFEASTKIHDSLDELLPSEYHELSLSQKAILALRSIEGVSSVLVGMRSEEYVEDVIYGLQSKPLTDPRDFWARLELQ